MYEGIAQISPIYVRVARTLGATDSEIFRKVIVPLTVPHMLTALRVALGVAWATLVASELIAAQQGLGALIQNASSFFQLDIIYVGIICIGLIALTMDLALRAFARRLVAWQERIGVSAARQREPRIVVRARLGRRSRPPRAAAASSTTCPTASGDGEFVSVIGPSGCGKTTMMNIVAGFVKPTAGAVLLDGRPIAGPGPDRGVIFQEYGVFPWLTVRAEHRLRAELAREPRAERRTRGDLPSATCG